MNSKSFREVNMFNHSNQISDTIKNFIYTAPEIIQGKPYDEKVIK